MPTEKPRITITMSDEQLDQIKEFQFSNKMKNQTQAILHLVELGFSELEKQNGNSETKKEAAPEPAKASSEAERKRKINMITALLESVGVSGDLTDTDLVFLEGIVTAVEAHFKKSNEPVK